VREEVLEFPGSVGGLPTFTTNGRPGYSYHRKLDEAVFAAYGLAPAATDETILAALLERNQRCAMR
jgi:hypothetical protein